MATEMKTMLDELRSGREELDRLRRERVELIGLTKEAWEIVAEQYPNLKSRWDQILAGIADGSVALDALDAAEAEQARLGEELDAQREWIEEASRVIDKLQWSADTNTLVCPVCDGQGVHAANCTLAQLLRASFTGLETPRSD